MPASGCRQRAGVSVSGGAGFQEVCKHGGIQQGEYLREQRGIGIQDFKAHGLPIGFDVEVDVAGKRYGLLDRVGREPDVERI